MKKIYNILFADFASIFRIINQSQRIKAIALFCCMLMQAFMELGFILVLSYMAMALTEPQQLNNTVLLRTIYWFFPQLVSYGQDSRYLLVIAGCIVVMFSFLKNWFAYLTARGTFFLSENISINVGREIMYHYLNAPYVWHLSGDSATTFQRMQWRFHMASMLISILSMYACLLTMLILFLSLLGNEPVMSTLVIGVTGIVAFLLYRSVRHKVDSNAKLAADSAQNETRAMMCATRGIRDVIIYRKQPVFLDAVTDAAKSGVAPRAYSSLAPNMPQWVLEATGFTIVVVALAYLVFFEDAKVPRISAALSMLLLTAWRVLPYANRVVGQQVGIRSVRFMVQQVVELLQTLRSAGKDVAVTPDPNFEIKGKLSFSHVYFRYPGAEHDSLHDISFDLPIGHKLGVIGPSGGGKSTLVALLSGLLPANSGEISVNDQPLIPERAAAMAAKVGYVPQSAFLFAGTLAENVAFSEWGQKPDMERVALACKRAAIDFVEDYPQKYALPIGENGAGLSGGQAQRVSIARALYGDPQMLIFDEATSALDKASEDSIQHTIEDLAGQTTCVIVAHRLTTVEKCDSLLWIDKGRIVRHGPTKEVLEAYEKSLQDKERQSNAN